MEKLRVNFWPMLAVVPDSTFPPFIYASVTVTLFHMGLRIFYCVHGKHLMTLDVEEFMHFLDGHKGSYEHKAYCIRYYYSVMENFADRAWGLHPLQLKNELALENNLQSQSRRLQSSYNRLSNQFNEVAGSVSAPLPRDESAT